MNKLNKEQTLIFAVLSAVTVLSVLLAVGFGALYLTGGNSLPADAGVSDTGTADGETTNAPEQQTTAEPSVDTSVLAQLQVENRSLTEQAASLQEELERIRGELAKAEADRTPQTPVDYDSLFNPGDLTPADPASLSDTFDLTAQLAVIAALEQHYRA